MWFTKLIKQFFFWIDKIVYNFIPAIYDLLLEIARTSILTQADILGMTERIYKLLTIFMVFKVTLSLITYVVNPDDFSDKTKGLAKLGTNIIISLSLLILTPYIFSYAYQIQTIVLEDNSLATLVFGDDLGGKNFLNSAGDEMAYITMQAFFSPNLSLDELYECTKLYEPVYDEDGNVSGKEMIPACYNALEKLAKTDTPFTPSMLANYEAGVENSSLGLLFRQDLVLANNGEEFIMDYKFIFSTAVGVVVVLLLVTFCMDVAVRSIKLAFYQLIAPIPILSYVDPKSGKDGLFKKWYEACFKTFLSLFIRLLALYFAIYVISKVGNMQLVDVVDGSYKGGFLLYVFIIIGALMFAKQLPKILEGLGIKLDGDGKFTLNPLKKFEEGAIGGKQIGKGIRGVGKYAGRLGKGLGTAALVGGASAITGHGFRGAGKTISGAWKGDKFGKNFSNSYGAAKARHKELEEMKANGVDPSDVRKAKRYNFFHGTTKAEKVAQVENKAKAIQTNYDTIKNQAISCDGTDKYKTIKDSNGKEIKVLEQKSAKTISKELDEMKKLKLIEVPLKNIEGKTKQQQYNEAIESFDNRIEQLKATKAEYMAKSGDINLDISKLKMEQSQLQPSNFSSETEFYETRAAYQQKIAILEQQKQAYDFSNFDKEIANEEENRKKMSVDDFEDIKEITADEQYAQAITEQKEAIKAKEAELEARINQLAKAAKSGETVTGNPAADKVISEAVRTMESLVKDVNEIGKTVDEKFEQINEELIKETDVVMMMKQSKGAAAQTTTGEMSKIKDIANYTKKNK